MLAAASGNAEVEVKVAVCLPALRLTNDHDKLWTSLSHVKEWPYNPNIAQVLANALVRMKGAPTHARALHHRLASFMSVAVCNPKP